MGKLRDLADIEGFEGDTTSFVEQCMMEDRYPAICTNPGCDYTDEMEPDQDRGWCEECKAGTMKSVLVLAGVI